MKDYGVYDNNGHYLGSYYIKTYDGDYLTLYEYNLFFNRNVHIIESIEGPSLSENHQYRCLIYRGRPPVN